jgi:hypothetical protein
MISKAAARSAGGAALFFLGASLVVTWPLARGLGRDVPADYGDPLYAAWALAWVSRQVGRVLQGDFEALRHFWDANQLYPEPATLALSDHFIAQALPLAPVYWLAGNPILTLNLAYLLAFTLSGVGVYLLVKELTESAAAGLVAGLVLPFNEFMLVFELSHLQVISTGWMPLSLFALRRFFVTGSRRTLAGAVACLVMSNLSAGYYLLMFPPFVALFCLWEIAARRLWRAPSRLAELGAAAAAVAIVTLPFVWPYLEVRQRYEFSRTVEDAAAMAATVDGYFASIRRLGVAYALAFVGAVCGALRLSGRWRPARVQRFPLTGFVAVAALLAAWLSLGPAPSWGGQPHPGLGLYSLFQQFVPGMSAVRVSSRFASVFLMFLAVLAGMGAAHLARLGRQASVAMVVLAGGVLIAANAPRPFPLNGEIIPADVRPPAAYLRPSPTPPQVYRYVAALGEPTVIAELPFGDLWYSTRYLYFSTFHWKRTVNGFTSIFPPRFIEHARWLINPPRTPGEAWRELQASGATHVIVHTGAWDEAMALQVLAFLESHGAKSHGRFDGAVVYELPR